MSNNRLQRSFFTRSDVTLIARELLGKELCLSVGDDIISGIIVETEAYKGSTDKACHAYQYRRTTRTETMFLDGGHLYVYLCYGIHHLLNVVTNVNGEPDAVLIRAVEWIHGEEFIRKNKSAQKNPLKWTSGPGNVCQAFGIDKTFDQVDLCESDTIWINDAPIYDTEQVISTTRVGVDYAGEDALLPWRFYIKDNPYISKK